MSVFFLSLHIGNRLICRLPTAGTRKHRENTGGQLVSWIWGFLGILGFVELNQTKAPLLVKKMVSWVRIARAQLSVEE